MAVSAAAVAVLLAGCSSGGGAASAGAASQATSSGSVQPKAHAAAAGTAAGSAAGGTGSAGRTSSGSEAGPGAVSVVLPGAPSAGAGKAVIGYVYRPASSRARGRFAAVTRSVTGMYQDVTVLSAVRAGRPQADLAIYSFGPERTQSLTFQGQIVHQMVAAAVGAARIRTSSVSGHPAAVAVSSVAALGWFNAGEVVVVLGNAGSNSLVLASSVAEAYSVTKQ